MLRGVRVERLGRLLLLQMMERRWELWDGEAERVVWMHGFGIAVVRCKALGSPDISRCIGGGEH